MPRRLAVQCARVALIVLLASSAGCVGWQPGYGLYDSTNPELRAHARAQAKEVERQRGREAEPLRSDERLVAAELRFHLPHGRRPEIAAQELAVERRGGRLFGSGTYVVYIRAQFNDRQRANFVAAAHRLHRHLDGSPRLELVFQHGAAGGHEWLVIE